MQPVPLSNDVPTDQALLDASEVTHVNYSLGSYDFGSLYRGTSTLKTVAVVTCIAGDIHRPPTGNSAFAEHLLEGLATGLEKEGFAVVRPDVCAKAKSIGDFVSQAGGAGHAKGSREVNNGLGNVVNIQHADKSGSVFARDVGADVMFFVGAAKNEAILYAYVPYGKFEVACQAKDLTTTFLSLNHGRILKLRYTVGDPKVVGRALARRFRLYYPLEEK
jgi:hypothetical protein